WGRNVICRILPVTAPIGLPCHAPARPRTLSISTLTRRLRSRATAMPEQYIFTIENLSKAYNKREVLKNIWLAFYPGAKIGVIGTNGAGKSTLLRVMAL